MKIKLLLCIVLFFVCKANFQFGLADSPWMLPTINKPICLVTQFDPFQDLVIGLLTYNAIIYCPQKKCTEIKNQIAGQKVAYITKKNVIHLPARLGKNLINGEPSTTIDILICTQDELELIDEYRSKIICIKTNQVQQTIPFLKTKKYNLFANVHNQNLTFVSWPIKKPISIQKNKLDSMQLITHDRHYFALEPVPTERKVLESLEKKPLDCPTTYFAYPWSMLINKKISKSNCSNIKVTDGFTVCQHIRYEHMLPIAKQIGLDTVFCPNVNKTY